MEQDPEQRRKFPRIPSENPVLVNRLGEDAVEALSQAMAERLDEPIRNARETLRGLETQLKARAGREERSKILGRIPSLMRKLARDLTASGRRSRKLRSQGTPAQA